MPLGGAKDPSVFWPMGARGLPTCAGIKETRPSDRPSVRSGLSSYPAIFMASVSNERHFFESRRWAELSVYRRIGFDKERDVRVLRIRSRAWRAGERARASQSKARRRTQFMSAEIWVIYFHPFFLSLFFLFCARSFMPRSSCSGDRGN